MRALLARIVGVAAVLLALAASAAPCAALGGRVARGSDVTRVLPPAGAVVEPYENAGYALRFVEGAVEIRVELAPIESSARFELPTRRPRDPLARTAFEAVGEAETVYAASSAILSWVGENIRYELDRELSQEPAHVLATRRGYCTGIARLTVALLGAVGIEAREVPGYRLESGPDGARYGFHRWVEIRLPDRGWLFSDPAASQHFVAATYLRLGNEELEREPGSGRLIERVDRIEEIDLAPNAPARVRVRPNDHARSSAALVVRFDREIAGEALLVGQGSRRSAAIRAGSVRFLGLAPGRYELVVNAAGRLAARKQIEFRAPVLAEVTIPVGSNPFSVGGKR